MLLKTYLFLITLSSMTAFAAPMPEHPMESAYDDEGVVPATTPLPEPLFQFSEDLAPRYALNKIAAIYDEMPLLSLEEATREVDALTHQFLAEYKARKLYKAFETALQVHVQAAKVDGTQMGNPARKAFLRGLMPLFLAAVPGAYYLTLMDHSSHMGANVSILSTFLGGIYGLYRIHTNLKNAVWTQHADSSQYTTLINRFWKQLRLNNIQPPRMPWNRAKWLVDMRNSPEALTQCGKFLMKELNPNGY